MPDDLGERTEEATPKRRQDAREEGNVPRSQDFAAAVLLLGVTLALWWGGRILLDQGALLLDHALAGDWLSDPLRVEGVGPFAGQLALHAARLAAPVLLIAWAVGALGQVTQIGWLFAPRAVAPKLSKLDPIRGAQRLFGLSGIVKAALDGGKVAAVILVTVVTIMQHRETMVNLPVLTVGEALVEIGILVLDLSLRVIALLLLLGVLDLAWQRHRHARDLRMTRQEVKDELKQTEGDPDVKRRRLRMQQQIAMQRIRAAVPKADVVVTNPEHISVAIRYDAATMAAPVVVAKGADHVALRIRQIALAAGVPIVERKPLARALYRAVDVGRPIPAEFYKAVAEILAYVYRLGGREVA